MLHSISYVLPLAYLSTKLDQKHSSIDWPISIRNHMGGDFCILNIDLKNSNVRTFDFVKYIAWKSELTNKISFNEQWKQLTNLAESSTPAMIPARKEAQLKWPISLGTETKLFVIGAYSWIISKRKKERKCSAWINERGSLILTSVLTQGLHSSSFSVDLSRLSAGLLNKCFHTTFDTYWWWKK